MTAPGSARPNPSRERSMAYETLIVETRRRRISDPPEPPDALNALNLQLMRELATALTAADADTSGALHRPDRIGQGLCRRGGYPRNGRQELCRRLHRRSLRTRGRGDPARPQAHHRGRRRLCTGRRLRAGHDVRFHHRRRDREVRPARDQPRDRRGNGRDAAPDPRGRQVEGDGHEPDRSLDGCGRGRTRRPCQPRRARQTA